MCTKLGEIHSKNAIPPIADSYSFDAVEIATCKLFVPKGSLSAYRIADGWSDFTNIIEEESTAISQTIASNIKVYAEQDAIVINGAELGDQISVYTESGALLQNTKVSDDIIRINVPTNHTYLIKTTGKTFKIAL